MKLSHPVAIKTVALLASWWLRTWFSTLDIRSVFEDPGVAPQRTARPHMYLFWHENLLIPTYLHAHEGVAALISNHRDGELIAQVIRMLRGGAVRGSTTRGGAAAVRRMLRVGRGTHLAITPDGPLGPRRVAQPGAVYLASRTGMPLVPTGISYHAAWRVRSWDRFAVPHPGSTVRFLIARPIDVPPDLDLAGIERYRTILQAALDRAQARADDARDAAWLG